MRIYLITYLLRGDSQKTKEDQLHGAIKALSGSWSNPLPLVWLVATDQLGAKDIAQRLADIVGIEEEESPDLLLVTRFDTEYYGRLPRSTWDWVTKVEAPSNSEEQAPSA